jgi:hypothetical protein
MFLIMFVTFAFGAKFLWVFNIKIAGIEYVIWVILSFLLVVLNFSSKSNKSFRLKTSYIFLLGLLIFFCIVNFFFSKATLQTYLLGFFFTFLFAFNFIIFYNVDLKTNHIISIIKSLVAIITFIGMCAYIERIFIPGTYNSYFLRGIYTLAKDPVYLATLLNLNIIFSLVLFQIEGKRKYIWISIFSFITISALLFIKSLIAAIIVIFAFISYFYYSVTVKYFFYTITVITIVLISFFGKPLVEEASYKYQLYFGENASKTPRNALYIAGYQIARDHFPFGSGQGTFGSYPVGKNYSDIYYDYQLNKVHGLGPEDAKGNTNSHFIFDTYWSGIMGEMGFIAFGLFLALWLYPAYKAFPYLKSLDYQHKSFAFIIVATIGSIFLESIAAPTPGQLQFIMLFAGLSAVLLKKILH